MKPRSTSKNRGEKTKKKAKKLEEKRKKDAENKFQKAAVLASLQPELCKWGTASIEKSATTLKNAREAVADFKHINALQTSHGALLLFV